MKIKICRNYEIEEPKKEFSGESKRLQELQKRAHLYLVLCVILMILSLILLIGIGILAAARQSQTVCPDEKAILNPKLLSAPCTLEECRGVCSAKPNLSHLCSKCDAGWQEFEGNCFYFSRHTCTWSKSREECRKMAADLVVIGNEGLQEFLIKKGNLAYWIGVIQATSGEAVWVNATVGESYWAKSQKEGKCGYLIGGGNRAHSWHISPCSHTTAYICQK